MRIRVMVAAKQAKARLNLRIFLRSCEGLEFAGEATNTAEAMTMCGKIKPDVLLVNLTFAELSLIPVIRVLRHQYPTTQMIILSNMQDEALKDDLQYAGVAHCLPGNLSRDCLVKVIQHAAAVCMN
jgi:DNA-binding NarL/FixJ family response regulator